MAWWWEKIDLILLETRQIRNEIDVMSAQLIKLQVDQAESLAILQEMEAAAQRAARVNISLGKPTDKRTK